MVGIEEVSMAGNRKENGGAELTAPREETCVHHDSLVSEMREVRKDTKEILHKLNIGAVNFALIKWRLRIIEGVVYGAVLIGLVYLIKTHILVEGG